MVRKQPCHMPCKTEGKAHSFPSKANAYSFKPITFEVARSKIEDLRLINPVEPFEHPYLGVCYATDKHVLTHAPASLPADATAHVAVCQVAYCRYTTHGPYSSREATKARDAQQKEQEEEAAGDEVDSHCLRTACFRSLCCLHF